MKDLMIDIETLDNKSTSVITQIGGIFFDRITGELGEQFLYNIRIQSCLDRGLTIGGETIKWWFDKCKLITWIDSPKDLTYVLTKFKEFVKSIKDVNIWSHSTFDIPIIEHAYNSIGQRTPINYRNTRDLRTLQDLTNVEINTTTNAKHNALEDCKFQIEYTVRGLNKC